MLSYGRVSTGLLWPSTYMSAVIFQLGHNLSALGSILHQSNVFIPYNAVHFVNGLRGLIFATKHPRIATCVQT